MTLHGLTFLALTCTCFSITHASAHAAKHIVKRTEIRSLASGAPGPLEFVELWVQATTVLSVSFDEPEQRGDSRIDRYLIEWSLSDDFHEAAQGLVLVSRAVPMKSYQYDIVNLPRGMKEQVYVRVMAHNAAGWGVATLSTPRHFAIADDDKAPGSSSRRGSTARFIATLLSRTIRFALILGVCAAIIALFYYCYVCMRLQHNQRGAYQSVPQTIDDPSVVESVRLDRAEVHKSPSVVAAARNSPYPSRGKRASKK